MTSGPKPYSIVSVSKGGSTVEDPYRSTYGESPYASEEGTRHSIASNPSHPNSQTAIAELNSRGSVLRNLALLIECAEEQRKILGAPRP